MNVLVTFKPINYMHPKATYAGLVKINVEQEEIINEIRIPSSSYFTNEAFMTNFAQGLAKKSNYIFVGLWNFVVVIEEGSFRIIDSFSSPEFADIHSIDIDSSEIYIVSTSSETLSCFNIDNLERKWLWGPNSTILKSKNTKFLPSIKNSKQRRLYNKFALRRFAKEPKWRDQELRYVHKTRSPYYKHHLNNVLVNEKGIFLNTKGWFDTVSSSVIFLSKDRGTEEFFVEPGGFIGSHDGFFFEGKYFVTEADNNSIAWMEPDKKIFRKKIKPGGYFIRGLERLKNSWIVGFTPMRGTNKDTLLIVFDSTFSTIKKKICLNSLLPDEVGVAIHNICLC